MPENAVFIKEPIIEPTALEPSHTRVKKYAAQMTTPIIAAPSTEAIAVSLTARKQAKNKARLTVTKIQPPTKPSILRTLVPKLSDSPSSSSSLGKASSQFEILAAIEKFVNRNWNPKAMMTPAINATKN